MERLVYLALYSHGHPYFAPEIGSDAKLLDRHQDPVALNYCLLEDSQNDWHPSRSAGLLVGKNLRRLLAASARPTRRSSRSSSTCLRAVQVETGESNLQQAVITLDKQILAF